MKQTLVTALNRPRLLVGIDPRLAAGSVVLSFLIAVSSNSLISDLLGALVFLVTSVGAYRLTKWEPRMMEILPLLVRQKAVYDPGKRAGFQVRFAE